MALGIYYREPCLFTKSVMINTFLRTTFLYFYLILSLSVVANHTNHHQILFNGVSWYDDKGQVINAHGACIIHDNSKYWLFGEYKSNGENKFNGFSCYSSTDLVHWDFERIVLSVQSDGILGPERIGERVKVMRCPSTGKYVMFMHADDMKYKDPYIGVAICDSINGEYRMLGPLLYRSKPIKRWDMGVFQDNDGKGYLLIHHGPIYRLSADYLSLEEKVAHVDGMGESPAMVKRNGWYFLLSSGLTSWERNDNFYFTSQRIEGPWQKKGLFCPEGSLTHNSQTTFILNVPMEHDTISVYMGDRWSFPKQQAAATYVWMPITFNGDVLQIPELWNTWNVHTMQAEIPDVIQTVKVGWEASVRGESLSYSFHGRRIGITGGTNSMGGYAKVTIVDSSEKVVLSTFVDFYSKVPAHGFRFVSPILEDESYRLCIEVLGEHSVWYDKKKNRFGSNGYRVHVENIILFE